MPSENQKPHKLAAIILNWNDPEGTAQTARALSTWQRLKPTVLVVDNGSSDDSLELISRKCPNAVVLRSEDNLGYAGGNNLGIHCALNEQFDLILLLNTDAEVSEEDALKLVSAMDSHAALGIVGPLVVEVNNAGETTTAGGRSIAIHPSTRIALRDGENTPEDEIKHVKYVPGTVLLAAAALFRTTGLLDELYFFSGEIADLCRRARQSGFECAVHYGAKATHRKVHASPEMTRLHAYYTLRNRFLYVRKHCGMMGILLVPYWILCGLYMWLSAILNRDSLRAQAILLALRDGVAGQYGNRNERFLT